MTTSVKFQKLFNRALNKAVISRVLFNAGAIVSVCASFSFRVDGVPYHVRYDVRKSDPVFQNFGYNKNTAEASVLFYDSKSMISGSYDEIDFIPERNKEMTEKADLTLDEKKEAFNSYCNAAREYANFFEIN